MEIKTGGPAFPLTEDAINPRNKNFDMQGMTLRDYFAAKVLPAFVSRVPYGDGFDAEGIERIALRTFEIADAMLKAREVTQ